MNIIDANALSRIIIRIDWILTLMGVELVWLYLRASEKAFPLEFYHKYSCEGTWVSLLNLESHTYLQMANFILGITLFTTFYRNFIFKHRNTFLPNFELQYFLIRFE